MAGKRISNTVIGLLLVIGCAVAAYVWQQLQPAALPMGFASGNGRIEATEIDIATKSPGRLAAVIASEGQMVDAGQVLAQMDIVQLQAQLREAQAQLKRAQASRSYASAIVAQRKSEKRFAEKEYERKKVLVKRALISKEKADQANTALQVAQAVLQAARVGVLEADAAIEAAVASTERIKAEINDGTLQAPVAGRILYRLAEPGEVMAAGGKVLTLLELTRVYMSIFLPTRQAGQVMVGDDARIVFDVLPDLVIPAKVSFVASRAQFTPKEVETRMEREKLMFRVKVQIDPALLKKHSEKVKTGVRGVAYVRLSATNDWPEALQVRLPE
ncbi:MAG: HlyD family secretion protein [Pontibacterium sp.]